MSKTGIIYALIDPRDRTVRYVGQTKTTTTRRVNGHLDRPASKVMGEWFCDMKAHNVRPYMHVLERPPIGELDVREHHWIAALCTHKVKLLNRIEPAFRALLEQQEPWPILSDLFRVVPDPSDQPQS